MKPFGLQTVLDYRLRLENIAQHRLTEAKRVEETVRQRLAEERAALARFIEELEILQREGIGITELVRHEERITARRHSLEAIKKNLTEKSALVAREQHSLIQRSRERQILERLKESQNESWQRHLSKKEAAILDEIGAMRHEPDKH